MKQIRAIFISGLLVLVPVIGTVFIIDIIVGLVDSIFGGILTSWGINSIWLRLPISILFVFLLGAATKTTIGSWAWRRVSGLLERAPLIKKIYGFAKDTTEMVLEKQSFNTVVRVYFGEVSMLGFLTNKAPSTVFCPTAPNVTSGIVLFTDKYEVIDMPIEDAMKQIISMGSIASKTYVAGK